MRLLAVLILALMAAACNQEQDITGSTAACPVRNYSSYNPRDMNQCVAACKACDHGNTVTCTTSWHAQGRALSGQRFAEAWGRDRRPSWALRG